MSYSVKIAPPAGRQLKKLPRGIQKRIVLSLARLEEDPRPRGVKKLAGAKQLYRLRLGDYRLVYQIKDRELLVLVVKIGTRQAIYKRLLGNA